MTAYLICVSKNVLFSELCRITANLIHHPCSTSYSHPYEYELQYWTPAASQLTPVEPQTPKALDETPLSMVTTEEELAAMVTKLKACSEFAVDLEVKIHYDLLQ